AWARRSISTPGSRAPRRPSRATTAVRRASASSCGRSWGARTFRTSGRALRPRCGRGSMPTLRRDAQIQSLHLRERVGDGAAEARELCGRMLLLGEAFLLKLAQRGARPGIVKVAELLDGGFLLRAGRFGQFEHTQRARAAIRLFGSRNDL